MVALLLIKPINTCHVLPNGFVGQGQCASGEVIAQKVKAPVDLADKGLIGVLFDLNRPPVVPAGVG